MAEDSLTQEADPTMYQEYRVRQIVESAIRAAMENAETELESEASTIPEDDAPSDATQCSNDIVELDEYEAARAHWIQLHKLNKQGTLMQSCFLRILAEFRHTRVLWHFGRSIHDTNGESWQTKLLEDFHFRHHCASVQAAITMIMENKDDPMSLARLLHEVGAHHFFYDAYEPHLEVFERALIDTMKEHLNGKAEELDEETERSWKSLLHECKTLMSEGIAIQRATYLRQSVTAHEIASVRQTWQRVVEYGVEEAGALLCSAALKEFNYSTLISQFHLPLPFHGLPAENTSVFRQLASMTMAALELMVNAYDVDVGFGKLADKLHEYSVTCMVLDVSPSLVRKAFMQAMSEMLENVLGRRNLGEAQLHTWQKMYRVLEQSILINIAEY